MISIKFSFTFECENINLKCGMYPKMHALFTAIWKKERDNEKRKEI